MLDSADLLLPSGGELFIAAGLEDEEAAVRHLLDRGIGEIVLKRGADGATFFGRSGERHNFSGFIVEEIDPTGAGDAFGATFLTSRRNGLTPEASLERAAAAGACNVTMKGPMAGPAQHIRIRTVHRIKRTESLVTTFLRSLADARRSGRPWHHLGMLGPSTRPGHGNLPRAPDTPVLIEATCNQGNQFRGYSGKTPADFAEDVRDLAKSHGVPCQT